MDKYIHFSFFVIDQILRAKVTQSKHAFKKDAVNQLNQIIH